MALIFSQLLKLGTGLLESGRHYLAASRAFIAGIYDLAHLGPPEPMMAVCGGSGPGYAEGCGGEAGPELLSSKMPVSGGVWSWECPVAPHWYYSLGLLWPRSVWTNSP